MCPAIAAGARRSKDPTLTSTTRVRSIRTWSSTSQPERQHATSKLGVLFRRSSMRSTRRGDPGQRRQHLNAAQTRSSRPERWLTSRSTSTLSGQPRRPDQAKQLLAYGGLASGVSLKLLYDDVDPDPQIAQVIQSSLAKAGITVVFCTRCPERPLGTYLATPADANRASGILALVDWGPDCSGTTGVPPSAAARRRHLRCRLERLRRLQQRHENTLINAALAATTASASTAPGTPRTSRR